MTTLDLIGTKNPSALALLMQLLNTQGCVLGLHEIRLRKGAVKAVDTLRRMGLVEVSKDIVQVVHIIDSEVVESTVKRKTKERPASWKETIRAKGGDPDKIDLVITGES